MCPVCPVCVPAPPDVFLPVGKGRRHLCRIPVEPAGMGAHENGLRPPAARTRPRAIASTCSARYRRSPPVHLCARPALCVHALRRRTRRARMPGIPKPLSLSLSLYLLVHRLPSALSGKGLSMPAMRPPSPQDAPPSIALPQHSGRQYFDPQAPPALSHQLALACCALAALESSVSETPR